MAGRRRVHTRQRGWSGVPQSGSTDWSVFGGRAVPGRHAEQFRQLHEFDDEWRVGVERQSSVAAGATVAIFHADAGAEQCSIHVGDALGRVECLNTPWPAGCGLFRDRPVHNWDWSHHRGNRWTRGDTPWIPWRNCARGFGKRCFRLRHRLHGDRCCQPNRRGRSTPRGAVACYS